MSLKFLLTHAYTIQRSCQFVATCFSIMTLLSITGCATTLEVRDVENVDISKTNVLKLTDYPANRDYTIIGTIEIKAYRAGLSQPTPDDVWSEVSKAVTSRGGNACLLRGSRSDDIWQRRIWVICEVLSVSEIQR